MPFAEGGKKPSFDCEIDAWSEAVLEKYERVSLQLRLIAEDVESDPKSKAFCHFMNLAQLELEQMQEQRNSLMSDYGFVFDNNYDIFLKNDRDIYGLRNGLSLGPVASSPA